MAAQRITGGFGSKLREARERRGITLRQIANATKISVSALEALERNDISRLPGGIFSRAFVRSYATEVGLDPEETIQEFIAQFPHDSVTAGHPASEQSDNNEVHESNRRMATVFVRLIAISVPIVAAVLYFGRGGRPASQPAPPRAPASAASQAAEIPAPPPPPDSNAAPPSQTSAPAASASHSPAAAPATREPPVVQPGAATSPVSAPAAQSITVAVVATAPCWLSATVDGERVVAHELRAGERHRFEGRDIVLNVGDAGAIDMTLNGAASRRLGSSGQVVTVRMTPENFRTYLASP